MTSSKNLITAAATAVAAAAIFFQGTTASIAQMRAAKGDQSPRPIISTQIVPIYPSISRRLGEQGTSELQLGIGTNGLVTDCRIIKSSGADRLDAAACDFVADHWRYQPVTHNGVPIASSARTGIVWNLRGVTKK